VETLTRDVQYEPALCHEQVQPTPIAMKLSRIVMPETVILECDFVSLPRKIWMKDQTTADPHRQLCGRPRQTSQSKANAHARLGWRLRTAVDQIERDRGSRRATHSDVGG
jgi:hypothetical protein